MADVHYNISVYDYKRNKLCDLYDSQNDLIGQAFDIHHEEPIDGIDFLDFSIPYKIRINDIPSELDWQYFLPMDWQNVKEKYKWGDGEDVQRQEVNFRWAYLKNEYIIRLTKDNKYYWFVAQRPQKSKSGNGIIGTLHCESIAGLLRTKNIYKIFDDTNGIGTINYLLGQVLSGTEWTIGEIDPMLEKDGVTEKVRSITSGGKEGSLALITRICNIFRARPIYDTDKLTLSVKLLKNRDQIIGVSVGNNLQALSVNYDSKDICTRMYVEGEYGEDGYVGIDDVNPTGLNYLMDFSYYKSIGVFTDEHQQAYDTYITNISSIVQQISENQRQMTEVENSINIRIGQCVLAEFMTEQGFTTPAYTYGDPGPSQRRLDVGDPVYVLNSDKTYRQEIIATTPEALIQSGDYAIVKFSLPSAGTIGGKESQIAAKKIEITNLEKKKNSTTKQDKIAEYQAEIERLEDEIEAIYSDENGLYDQMYEVFKPGGLLSVLDNYSKRYQSLRLQQDMTEATFIIAMDNMLREGAWSNNNYVPGQEQELYNDACDVMEQMAKPSAAYTLDYIRMTEEYGVPLEQIQVNALIRADDDELDIHDNLYITKKITGIDDRMFGQIETSNKDITLGESTLSALLSRMSQLSDMIDQKNAIYERAKAISKSGTFYAERLNGQIDVVRNQILSSVSNWYTDENGNILFVSADGGSAMMLSGAGFMLANSKDEHGNWNWRTKTYHWFSPQ